MPVEQPDQALGVVVSLALHARAHQSQPGRQGNLKEPGHVTGGLVYVWSFGPPFGGWGNPSLVGANEITDREYFEDGDAQTL